MALKALTWCFAAERSTGSKTSHNSFYECWLSLIHQHGTAEAPCFSRRHFADDSHNLAGVDFKADVFEGLHSGEALADCVEGEQGLGHVRVDYASGHCRWQSYHLD